MTNNLLMLLLVFEKKEANYVLSLNIMQFEQSIQATSKVTCNYLVISINVLTNR